MEDYQAAFLQRYEDTERLCSSPPRKIAAMHFGGITVECLLKSIIFDSLPKSASREWKTDENDPGHTITNPGHSFENALKRCQKLYSRAQKFPEIIKWLNLVENPDGHFIDMRYSGVETDDKRYKEWLNAYERLIGWLQKQRTQL
jgi:hypothetical protein